MKSYLKTTARIMLLTSVSTSLQVMAATNTDNDDGLQLRSQSAEMTSEIDGPKKSAATSEIQSQGKKEEVTSPAPSEKFLEQVRVNSKMQAAEAAYNLSILAVNRKDFTLARTFIEESMQLNQSNPNYPMFAADIAFLTQNFDKAVTYQMKVLEIARSMQDVDDLQIALIQDQLGAIYIKQEDYKKAKSSLMESLQLREKMLGENNLMVIISLNKLASLAVRQDQPIVAESLLKRSLKIARDESGPRHSNSATMLANLADFYQSETRLEEAEALYEEAISIWSDSSVDSLKQAVGQDSLGRLFLKQQRFDDARLQFQQVLVLLKQNYTQDHPYVQRVMSNLANLDAERERSEEKDGMFDELVREFSTFSPKHI